MISSLDLGWYLMNQQRTLYFIKTKIQDGNFSVAGMTHDDTKYLKKEETTTATNWLNIYNILYSVTAIINSNYIVLSLM